MSQSGEDWRADKRSDIEELFEVAERQLESVNVSPSGRYRLEVFECLRAGEGWDYTEGVVRSSDRDEAVATVQRNYPAFPFTWCEGHPSGHDYLICGEDYQGQTVVELDTRQRVDHLPADAQSGHGFCWAAHYVAPDKGLLVVDGCIWACPYELVLYDFSAPMVLPYEELGRWPVDSVEGEGFNADGELVWFSSDVVRRSDGKSLDETTAAEDAELRGADGHFDSTLVETVKHRSVLVPGQPVVTSRVGGA